MKDSFQLLGTALLLAVLAWSFWHFLGQNALTIFSTMAIILLLVDNLRLRRSLKETKEQEPGSDSKM